MHAAKDWASAHDRTIIVISQVEQSRPNDRPGRDALLSELEVDIRMTRVSISELKAKLSQFLDRARSGEEVIVTDRGRPVARIVRVTGREGGRSRLSKLIRTGRISPPHGQQRTGPDLLDRPADPKGRALEILLEERRSGR